MVRLATGIWVQAYLMRLGAEHIPAYVLAHGDDTGGAVIVKLATLDGRAQLFQRMPDLDTGATRWQAMAEGPEAEIDARLDRQRRSDPDLWIIEVESRAGRTLLDDPSLA